MGYFGTKDFLHDPRLAQFSVAGHMPAPWLRDFIANAQAPRYLWGRAVSARLTDLDHQTSFGGRLVDLAGRSILLATESQLTTALALIELDGIARRLVILPPDAEAEHVGAVITAANIDAAVIDDGTSANAALDLSVRVLCAPSIAPMTESLPSRVRTEWVLMTSGTTGVPKMVMHDLAGLTAAIQARSPADGAHVWGTFYDIRRYGGLQIFLRAVLGGASLVLSSAGEPIADHLARLAKHGVTHLSGTPSTRKMHQYDLTDCTAAACYMDVKKWAPRRHDGNGQKTSRKMPG